MIIRNAVPEDNAAVRDVVSAAFGHPDEADLLQAGYRTGRQPADKLTEILGVGREITR
jgi:hypothetical protein